MNDQHAATRAFAWAGAALFVAALAYFLFSYSVTFGEIATGDVTGPAVALNVALFSAFALHHSVFARLPVRAFVRRIVPSQLERSAYVWVASLMLMAVCYFWQPIPGVLWQLSAPGIWVTRAVQLAAIWLTLRSAVVIDAFDLAGVRQVLNPKPQTSEFKTDGPYGWVRHPIYLGWILIVFSVAVMTNTRLLFATVSSVYLLVAIPFEERTIRAQSPSYEDYSRTVPWRLIPRIY